MISAITHWPTGPVQLEWHPLAQTDFPVTASHAFVFGASGIVVADVASRGITIPGGHIENGETTEQCVTREIVEELQVSITGLRLLGYIACDHSVNSDYSGPYPKQASQAVYYCRVAEYHSFRPSNEVTRRLEVSRRDLPSMHHEWNVVLDAALGAAVSMAKTNK